MNDTIIPDPSREDLSQEVHPSRRALLAFAAWRIVDQANARADALETKVLRLQVNLAITVIVGIAAVAGVALALLGGVR